MSMTYPCYWLGKDDGRKWYWVYFGRNAEEIARSSARFANRGECTDSIALMKASRDDEVYHAE